MLGIASKWLAHHFHHLYAALFSRGLVLLNETFCSSIDEYIDLKTHGVVTYRVTNAFAINGFPQERSMIQCICICTHTTRVVQRTSRLAHAVPSTARSWPTSMIGASEIMLSEKAHMLIESMRQIRNAVPVRLTKAVNNLAAT